MFVVFKEQPRSTRPGKELCINTDHIIAITPNDDTTTFITMTCDSSPRYLVDAPFYEVIHKVSKHG